MSLDIEKNISQLIETQFPELYREEGEQFIKFIMAYFEWLESENQTLYHSRRLTDYRDIDNTIDDFIINFKNKYLSNVQFNVATNKKLFIKNALDFYRAKGTERAVDLFFKLIYGLEARVYYPGDDLFKLSDNEWRDQKYLEIRPNKKNINFVGEQIIGSISGASAFVERLVRVKKDNQYIEVLYITDASQDFVTNERIRTIGNSTEYSAQIDGSLTTFEITASTDGFSVGETVYVSDGKGKKAKAVVASTTDYVGVVDFEVLEGGWGYTANAQIIGSERVLRLDDITFENTDYLYHHDPISVFETVQQDLLTLEIDQTNVTIEEAVYDLIEGTQVFAYTNNDPANTVIFEGKVAGILESSNKIVINFIDENYRDSNNDLIVDLYSNTTPITSFFTANAELEIPLDQANGNIAIVDATSQGNVIAWDDTMTLQYSDASGGSATINNGDKLYQVLPDGQPNHIFTKITVANTFTVSTDKFINAVRSVGWPRTNINLIRENDGAEFTIQNMSNTYCGVIGVNGEIPTTTEYFFETANTYGANTRLHSANNDSFSFTEEANFQIFEREEVQSLRAWDSNEVINEMPNALPDGNTFFIQDFNELSNNDIWADANGYPGFTSILEGGDSEFTNTTIQDFLSISDNAVELGSVSGIVVSDPGRGYSRSPFFIVYEPMTRHLERYDFYIRYRLEDEIKTFRINEKITVPLGNANSKGIIREHNAITGELRVTRLHVTDGIGNNDHLSVADDFQQGDTIQGETTGISADIEMVDEFRMQNRTGINADIKAEAFSGSGFATSLRVINSGFGYFGRRSINGAYFDGEVLNLISEESSDRTIQALAYLGKGGIGEGYHPNRKSFLSSDKYLQDNDFYQDYSYQVLTALPFNKYKQTLIEILHVAGTKPFGGFVGTSENTIAINVEASSSEFNIKQYPLFVNENTFFANTVVSLV